MTYAELIKSVAAQTGKTQGEVRDVLAALQGVVLEKTASGERVNLSVIGSFNKAERAARKGHNPATGESIDIPARSVPVFKASRGFKKHVHTA